jgi:YD repeat-containing protein
VGNLLNVINYPPINITNVKERYKIMHIDKLNKLNSNPICIKYDDKGRVAHMRIENIQGGSRCNIDLEYDNIGRVIKSIDYNSNNLPVTTTYEYDQYNRLVRTIESKYGYDDIEAIYEYENDRVIKTLNHSKYRTITKTNQNMDVIYQRQDYLDDTTHETTFKLDYDKKILNYREIFQKDGKIVRTVDRIKEFNTETVEE